MVRVFESMSKNTNFMEKAKFTYTMIHNDCICNKHLTSELVASQELFLKS